MSLGLPAYVFVDCFLRSIKSGSTGFAMSKSFTPAPLFVNYIFKTILIGGGKLGVHMVWSNTKIIRPNQTGSFKSLDRRILGRKLELRGGKLLLKQKLGGAKFELPTFCTNQMIF